MELLDATRRARRSPVMVPGPTAARGEKILSRLRLANGQPGAGEAAGLEGLLGFVAVGGGVGCERDLDPARSALRHHPVLAGDALLGELERDEVDERLQQRVGREAALRAAVGEADGDARLSGSSGSRVLRRSDTAAPTRARAPPPAAAPRSSPKGSPPPPPPPPPPPSVWPWPAKAVCVGRADAGPPSWKPEPGGGRGVST